MFLTGWRCSKAFRITAFLILFDFLTFQNLYGQEYAVQEGTHRYTPVREKGADPFPLPVLNGAGEKRMMRERWLSKVRLKWSKNPARPRMRGEASFEEKKAGTDSMYSPIRSVTTPRAASIPAWLSIPNILSLGSPRRSIPMSFAINLGSNVASAPVSRRKSKGVKPFRVSTSTGIVGSGISPKWVLILRRGNSSRAGIQDLVNADAVTGMNAADSDRGSVGDPFSLESLEKPFHCAVVGKNTVSPGGDKFTPVFLLKFEI